MVQLAKPSRRGVIAGAALSATAASAASAAKPGDRMTFSLPRITADLDRYAGYGVKASGGEGDTATGAWMEAELKAAGYAVQRQPFETPFFTLQDASLRTSEAMAQLIPQALVTPTGATGVEGPLAIREIWTKPETRCDGAIVLLVLPYARWSSAASPAFRKPVDAAFAAGAAAVVLITTGPTGEAIALNAPAGRKLFDRPVATMAPREAAPFLAAAQSGGRARFVIDGDGGHRPAFNLVAKLDRGVGRGLIVSTPRSGWFTCGGERGPGVAAWLALMRWAPAALPHHDLTFLATSGHEYENHGGEQFIKSALAPAPAATALWTHLGANVAARDWNDLGRLVPLKGADSQRILMVSPPLAETAKIAFAGQPGLQDVRVTDAKTSAGELSNILAAGYGRVAGVFGAHRFHHVASDDAQHAQPEATLAAAIGFRDLIVRTLGA
jgi:hypothetical protein